MFPIPTVYRCVEGPRRPSLKTVQPAWPDAPRLTRRRETVATRRARGRTAEDRPPPTSPTATGCRRRRWPAAGCCPTNATTRARQRSTVRLTPGRTPVRRGRRDGTSTTRRCTKCWCSEVRALGKQPSSNSS